MNPELFKRIRQLVSEGRYDEALNMFDASWADINILALKSRLQLLQQKKLRGIISVSDETVETNSLVNSLLQWTDENENTSNLSNPTETIKVDAQLILLIKKKLADSLTFYYLITFIPIAAGFALATFFYLDNGINALEGFGSALISSISGLSIRELINRRDRISFLEILLVKIETIKDKFEIQKINNLSWSIIESTISRSKINE